MGPHRELARTLRTMCAKRHQHSCDDIAAFLDTLTPEAAATAVVEGNRNGKAAVHFACQMRPDDGAATVELLLRAVGTASGGTAAVRSAVNAATRRGHTPLIYAAGRGHDDVALLLLARGASPRVYTVLGDTALNMGRGWQAGERRGGRPRL